MDIFPTISTKIELEYQKRSKSKYLSLILMIMSNSIYDITINQLTSKVFYICCNLHSLKSIVVCSLVSNMLNFKRKKDYKRQ